MVKGPLPETYTTPLSAQRLVAIENRRKRLKEAKDGQVQDCQAPPDAAQSFLDPSACATVDPDIADDGIPVCISKKHDIHNLRKIYSQRLRVERRLVTTLSYGLSGKPKVLCYDLRKLVTYGGILLMLSKGTIFADKYGLASFLGFQALVGAMFLVVCEFSISDHANIPTSGIEDLTMYINQLCPFVVGLFLSIMLERWWTLRCDALGRIFDAVNNICMQIAVDLPGQEYDELRWLVMKWMMAVVFLVVKAARGDDKLDDLVAKGILSQSEVDRLLKASLHGRAQMCLGWVARLATESMHKGSGPSPHSISLCSIYKCVMSARMGIQTIHTHLHTQLPFAYVHLIALLVNVNIQVVTIKCCLIIIVNVHVEPANYMQCAYQMCMFLTVPVLYHGLLSITYVLEDPFGEDMLDFPIGTFIEYLASTVRGCLDAQALFPWELVDLETTGPPPAGSTAAAREAMAALPPASARKTNGQPGPALRRTQSAKSAVTDAANAAVAVVAKDMAEDALSTVMRSLTNFSREVERLHETILSTEDRRAADAKKLVAQITPVVSDAKKKLEQAAPGSISSLKTGIAIPSHELV